MVPMRCATMTDVAPCELAFERLPQLLIRLVVERREGVVKQEDLRLAADGAGNGEALFLSARKLVPPCDTKAWYPSSFFSTKSCPCAMRTASLPLLFGKRKPLLFTVGDVALHRSREHHGTLRDITDPVMQGGQRVFLDVDCRRRAPRLLSRHKSGG